MKNEFRLILTAILALFLAQMIWAGSFYFFSLAKTKKHFVQQKKATLHVFVHGTFGSSLGFLSFFPVVHDDFKGSHYIKTARLMRKDPFFYKDQPMLERGLVPVLPSYVCMPCPDKKIAQALIKGYAEINAFAKQSNESENFFYTFGWSGLLSKKHRREESIRLYNALSIEKQRLEAQGYKIKIFLAAHSHGGNLALNLAGINRARDKSQALVASSTPIHKDERKKMGLFFKKLPVFAKAVNKKGGKRFDFKPEGPMLWIDRLYLLGTPIQPETDHYALDHKTFRKIYNFYSDNDPIQRLDWVSTAQYYSKQRFSLFSQSRSSSPHITQVRIIFDKKQKELHKNDSWFAAFFSKNAHAEVADDDPTHRDLWFIAHHKAEEDQTFLYPLPLFIFCPLIHSVIKKKKNSDVDISLSRMHQYVRFDCYDYNSNRSIGSEFLPLSQFKNIKKELLSWQPSPQLKQHEFSIVAAHVKKASLKK